VGERSDGVALSQLVIPRRPATCRVGEERAALFGFGGEVFYETGAWERGSGGAVISGPARRRTCVNGCLCCCFSCSGWILPHARTRDFSPPLLFLFVPSISITGPLYPPGRHQGAWMLLLLVRNRHRGSCGHVWLRRSRLKWWWWERQITERGAT